MSDEPELESIALEFAIKKNLNVIKFAGKGAFKETYWSNRILSQFKEEPGKAWAGLSWRHYLSWFGKTEREISNGNPIKTVKDWLKNAETNRLMLEDEEILLEEPRNNGSWLRPWRQAMAKFSKFYDV